MDELWNKCGSTDLEPSKYWLLKPFEPGLKKSDTSTPCADRNFDDYKNTSTHKFGPFQITYDIYGPEKLDIEKAERI